MENNKLEINTTLDVDPNLDEQQKQVLKQILERFTQIIGSHICDPVSINEFIEEASMIQNIDAAKDILADIISCDTNGDEYSVLDLGKNLAIASMVIVCQQQMKYEKVCGTTK